MIGVYVQVLPNPVSYRIQIDGCVCAGYANPRFLRSTMYNVPCTSDMLKASHIPFALALTPFARLGSQEVGVTLSFCSSLNLCMCVCEIECVHLCAHACMNTGVHA